MTAPLRPLPVLARTALKATLLAAGGFACYWTYLTVNQGRLLFDARRRPAQEALPDGISLYAHEVPGGMLSGYVYQDAGAGGVRDLLFYLPGRGEDVLQTMQHLKWLPRHIGFASFDYRGLGHSDGRPGEAAAVADASQFLLHLRRALPGTRVHVVGRSLGTGVAIQLADLQDFESLQLITPYDSLLELASKRFPLVPMRQLMRHHFDSISHCEKVMQRTKVLLAEHDNVVPHACSERLMAAWPGQVARQTMAGTDHYTIIEQPETWLALSEFALQSDMGCQASQAPAAPLREVQPPGEAARQDASVFGADAA